MVFDGFIKTKEGLSSVFLFMLSFKLKSVFYNSTMVEIFGITEFYINLLDTAC